MSGASPSFQALAIYILGQCGFTKDQTLYETPLGLVNQIILSHFIAQGAEMDWEQTIVRDDIRQRFDKLKEQWPSEQASRLA